VLPRYDYSAPTWSLTGECIAYGYGVDLKGTLDTGGPYAKGVAWMPKLIAVLSMVWLWTLPTATANQSSPLELNATQTQLISQINELRLARSLSSLTVDTLRCYFVETAMQRVIRKGYEDAPESTWVEQVEAALPDWDKRGFMAAGGSTDQIYRILEGRQEFIDALTRHSISHIVVADVPRSRGGTWCTVWLIHRLVHIDDTYRVRTCYEGPTYFTVSGTSPYKQVRVRFYKSLEDPTTYKGKDDDFVELETNDAGRFQATLPISKFGEGEYRIIVYVRNVSEEEYSIAAHTHFSVTH